MVPYSSHSDTVCPNPALASGHWTDLICRLRWVDLGEWGLDGRKWEEFVQVSWCAKQNAEMKAFV